MNRLILIITLIITGVELFSQDCEAYFPMEKGTTFEVTSYNRKGKAIGKSVQQVIEKSVTGDNITAKIDATNYDNKDKFLTRSDYVVKCEEGKFLFDMAFFLNQDQMKAYQKMEMKIDGNFLEFPANMKVDDTLNDGHITVVVGNSKTTVITIKVDITNRVVEAIEDVITPTGTYTCVKIAYKLLTKSGIIKANSNVVEWYAKGVGLVKSEAVNNNGKFLSKRILTKFEQ